MDGLLTVKKLLLPLESYETTRPKAICITVKVWLWSVCGSHWKIMICGRYISCTSHLPLHLLGNSILTWYIIYSGLTFGIPVAPPTQYLTLSLRQLGFGTFETNLLTIPSIIGGMITLCAITLLSEAFHERTYLSMTETAWMLPFLIALYTLPDFPNQWVFYVRKPS